MDNNNKIPKKIVEAYRKKGVPEEVLNHAYYYSEFENPADFFKSDTIVSSGPTISKYKNETVKKRVPIEVKILDHAGKANYKGKIDASQAGFQADPLYPASGGVGGQPFYRFNTKEFNNYIAKIRNNNK